MWWCRWLTVIGHQVWRVQIQKAVALDAWVCACSDLLVSVSTGTANVTAADSEAVFSGHIVSPWRVAGGSDPAWLPVSSSVRERCLLLHGRQWKGSLVLLELLCSLQLLLLRGETVEVDGFGLELATGAGRDGGRLAARQQLPGCMSTGGERHSTVLIRRYDRWIWL